ncbi:lysine--tRNA ligase [candidate division CPR3 bacterium GWF2_35_18]|uniref:Lysine--tRNA ligase n=1 Tax=candidate division CPR3 bacterium GW2011_GWF2_35_18 TaxID=1618350 RepID=A0A0G0E4V9_UNCC3|nr:MAG: Lysine-tRNA ligase [candidate division CPR3 bacterium GW2011_GWF2_35_18]KKP85322.1 MAG: Lysine-tRNA ligase [candidate division CPR3 bacterium GW2011_GWE2_35_7]OGB63573.1 MAG: lysine--tRNA ligase [candidate division CPR3 bacterium GWF2_35_18]OGB64682.1 MAG: lysine--tRNA ligase [candidate division CPR3 bacterium RIFOXYA2_FULL_35_13]OGB75796.1 MAG: lysine--tRNA ligase [candidate division CPR3 bacterium RIFOXYC2_FULL_35_7]OGB79077.1 MAG: lysine--tRNA ligase [candidate division CPR3 bacteri
MFWADKLATEIKNTRREPLQWVDDMKTPSGRIHVGSLVGVLLHDFIYKSLLYLGVKAKYTYVFNDFDPMDGLPSYLDQKEYEKHMGKPLFTIPSPDKKSKSLGHQYAYEFIEAMQKLGAKPEILWSHELYQSGKMNDAIKTALDKVDLIRLIYKEVGNYDKPKHWYPFQPVCPKCGKVGTTEVFDWDGKEVSFRCVPNLVKWAIGCGYEGKVSPFNGTGKLMWKVDWPAHWKTVGITVEGAGKDHSSAGGSRDMAVQILKDVYNYPNPYDIPYEWFLIKGKKMSSSKGVGTSASEFVKIFPPTIGRFLFARNRYNRQANFDPEGMTIPDLFDEYDRCAHVYWEQGNTDDFGRIYEVAQIDDKKDYQTPKFLPRFLDIAKAIQDPKVEFLADFFAKEKRAKLTKVELDILKERKQYAEMWLKNYAPEDFRLEVKKDTPISVISRLSNEQTAFLSLASGYVKELKVNPKSDTEIQNHLYQLGKSQNLKPKETFSAIYQSLLGKEYGPKAGALILSQDLDLVAEKFKNVKVNKEKAKTISDLALFRNTDLIQIDPSLQEKYPSISVGVAIIRDVKIVKTLPELTEFKKEFLASLSKITVESLKESPNLLSYRKLYRAMGVDWHSRRPSPEALLRRLAQGKELYSVNTLVDAYNLVVMKTHVSVGAFDLQNIQFPTLLKAASGGEKILLHGDEKETVLKNGEICYFDKKGPYNLDFNYRDAQRTLVKDDTRDIWINVDGVYEVAPQKVWEALQLSVEFITRFCGGKVDIIGVLK